MTKKMASKNNKNKDINCNEPNDIDGDSGNTTANKNTQKLRMYLAVSG